MAVVKAMNDKEKLLFALFRKALQAEKEAQAMYKEAIEACEDATTKKVLQGFYEDEVRHEKEVYERYKQFKAEFDISD